ncbi:hypothetical protein EUX98_g3477 [Antrodiella citrinella]|uniref:Chromo domain-containing protein n=1 Tax=Antrodiella citrinella TaxID=2447956 RepID=A0A4S4MWG3_9APHY|nr:hypothetical protein EUX98_g3477 [Antrodiella citrinella]
MARTKGPTHTWISAIPVPSRKNGKPGPAKGSVKTVSFAGQNFPVSPVLDTLYWYMAERHRMHQHRLAGEDPPWSNDEIMNSFPFTNVFRVYDRTTQYILRNVIRKGSQDLEEMCFRVILFRLFNKLDTWEHMEELLGTPTLKWSEFDVETYDSVLSDLAADGTALYCGCYISPAPPFGWHKNHSNHLRLVQVMMDNKLPVELKGFKHLKDANGRLCLYPSIGAFIAQQYVHHALVLIRLSSSRFARHVNRLLLDLNMTPHFKWSEREWAALGPGSSACLRKIFGPSVSRYEQEALQYLYESQMSHFTRLGIVKNQVPRLCDARPAGVSSVDIEHSLCECEKYSRGRFPHIKGKRTVVGRPYVQNRERITAELPSHWLQPLPKPPPPPAPPAVHEANGVPFYEVSHIVAERNVESGRYLVRWVGYGPEDDWWLTEKELEDGAGEVLQMWNNTKDRINKRIEALR